MSLLALNLLLALTWMLLSGNFSIGSMLAGFFAGFVSIAALWPFLHSGRYVRGTMGLGRLMVVYAWWLVVSNVQVARDVLRFELPFRPGILRVDATDLNAFQTVVFANLVSLTPGSIILDADAKGNQLYVLTLYAGDPEAARREVRLYARLVRAASGLHPRKDRS